MNNIPTIAEVLDLYPSITAEGYGIYQGPNRPVLLNDVEEDWLSEDFENSQSDIYNTEAVIKRVYTWMSSIEKSEEIYRGLVCSDLADFMKMVPQVDAICLPGAFIVAAVQHGFELEVVGNGLEVCFNFDAASLRRALPENLRQWVQ